MVEIGRIDYELKISQQNWSEYYDVFSFFEYNNTRYAFIHSKNDHSCKLMKVIESGNRITLNEFKKLDVLDAFYMHAKFFEFKIHTETNSPKYLCMFAHSIENKKWFTAICNPESDDFFHIISKGTWKNAYPTLQIFPYEDNGVKNFYLSTQQKNNYHFIAKMTVEVATQADAGVIFTRIDFEKEVYRKVSGSYYQIMQIFNFNKKTYMFSLDNCSHQYYVSDLAKNGEEINFENTVCQGMMDDAYPFVRFFDFSVNDTNSQRFYFLGFYAYNPSSKYWVTAICNPENTNFMNQYNKLYNNGDTYNSLEIANIPHDSKRVWYLLTQNDQTLMQTINSLQVRVLSPVEYY